MRILAILRQVLDAEETVRVQNGVQSGSQGGFVDLASSNLVMDTMDEYGVEQGIRLRESGAAEEVVALAVGPARVQDALRTALAMGADRAIHVAAAESLDPIALSKVAAQVAQEETVDLIFTGGQQADWDSHALGPATAERLGWPQVTWVNALELKDGIAEGSHDAEDGNETFRVSLPLVVTTQQGLNEPRYPTVPNIMKAKKKEIREDSLERFQVKPLLRTVSAEIQTKARLNRILDGKDAQVAASQLVDFLRNEARVIP
jgi:electron transfer flavoprotein beta subunit